MRVLIDPGHGGDDRGAVSDGVEEAPINLDVAFKLYTLLKSANEYDAELVRFGDVTCDWGYRRRREREYRPDVVLSLHCDSSSNPRNEGIKTFCWPGNDYAYNIALAIGRAAPRSLRPSPAFPRMVNKEEWPRAYYLVSQYRAPVVLVEMGYLSNVHDREILQDEGTQRSLVAAMFCGISYGFKLYGFQPRDKKMKA